MEIDKTTVGLSLILAVVVAMLVFSTSSLVMANTASQNVTVTKNVTAVVIVNQSGLAANDITGWAFSGVAGETNATPANAGSNGGQLQGFAAGTPVTFLNNTHSGSMLVHITAGVWGNASLVGTEYYITTAPADASQINNDFVYGTSEEITGGIGLAADAKKGLWLKLQLKRDGTTTSEFLVESEVL